MFNLLIILPFLVTFHVSVFLLFCVCKKKAEKGRFHTALFFVGVTFGKIGHHSPASCSCAAFVVYAKVKGSPDSVVDFPPFLVLLFLFLIRSFLSLLWQCWHNSKPSFIYQTTKLTFIQYGIFTSFLFSFFNFHEMVLSLANYTIMIDDYTYLVIDLWYFSSLDVGKNSFCFKSDSIYIFL